MEPNVFKSQNIIGIEVMLIYCGLIWDFIISILSWFFVCVAKTQELSLLVMIWSLTAAVQWHFVADVLQNEAGGSLQLGQNFCFLLQEPLVDLVRVLKLWRREVKK